MMPRGRMKALVLVLLTLLVVGAYWVWSDDGLLRRLAAPAVDSGRSDARIESNDVGTETELQSARFPIDPVTTQSDVATPQLIAVPALPALGAPLADHIDELVRRAERGDAQAARRLFEDVSICRLGRMFDRYATVERSTIPDRAHKNFEVALEGWRATQLQRCVRTAMCTGLSAAQLNNPDRWLRQAAELGERNARVRYASGQQFHLAQSLDTFDNLDHWRQRAVPWLEQAVADADPLAISVMARVLSTPREQRGTVLNELIATDPARGYALWYALSLAPSLGADANLQRSLAAAANLLDGQQLRRARQAGSDIYRRNRRTLDQATPESLRVREAQFTPAQLERAPSAPGCRAQVEAMLQSQQP